MNSLILFYLTLFLGQINADFINQTSIQNIEDNNR